MNNTPEYLGNGIYVYVSAKHRFGYDALLLARFAAPKKSWQVIDLCCGCGIIPLLFARDFTPESITGIDIEPEAIEIFKQSIHKNRLPITAVCADLRDLNNSVQPSSFDLVSCNPPYFATGSGRISSDIQTQTARHDISCTLRDVVQSASKLLKNGGRLAVCFRPERLVDLMTILRDTGIEPKRIRYVHQSADSAPFLLLAEGKKGGKPGIRTEKPLFIKKMDNQYTDEAKEIFEVQDNGR